MVMFVSNLLNKIFRRDFGLSKTFKPEGVLVSQIMDEEQQEVIDIKSYEIALKLLLEAIN